jgi:predicted GTPase
MNQQALRAGTEKGVNLEPKRERAIIMGAAGRDFHTFNICFRDDPSQEIVAFTAAS